MPSSQVRAGTVGGLVRRAPSSRYVAGGSCGSGRWREVAGEAGGGGRGGSSRHLPREERHLVRDDHERHTRLDVGLGRQAGAPRGAAQRVLREGVQLLGAAGDAAQRRPVTEGQGVAEQVIPVGERDRRGGDGTQVGTRVGGRRCEGEILLRLRLLVAAPPPTLRPPRGGGTALGRRRGCWLGE